MEEPPSCRLDLCGDRARTEVGAAARSFAATAGRSAAVNVAVAAVDAELGTELQAVAREAAVPLAAVVQAAIGGVLQSALLDWDGMTNGWSAMVATSPRPRSNMRVCCLSARSSASKSAQRRIVSSSACRKWAASARAPASSCANPARLRVSSS